MKLGVVGLFAFNLFWDNILMKNHYVIDTSVLINDPGAFKKLDGDVTVPIAVIEELDKLKKQPGEVGRAARQAIRELDGSGDLHLGCKVGKNTLKVDGNHYDCKEWGSEQYGDNRILACLKAICGKKKSAKLLSADLNLRIRARSAGLPAEAFISTQVDNQYSGCRIMKDPDVIQELMEKGSVEVRAKEGIKPHEGIIFQDQDGHEVAVGRNDASNKIRIVRKQEAWGIVPRSSEQTLALDMLMDQSIPLVSLIGKAGGGKSLLALAAALELVLNRKRYSKLVIYKPIVPVGNDIGYLPGDKREKLLTWCGSILDNLEVLLSSNNKAKRQKAWLEELYFFMDKGQIEIDALTYIRGRSINNAIILVDEAQNLTPQDAKTILSRVGNSRIFLTGDTDQIDNRNLDSESNAISLIADKFKDSKLSGHITLTKCERSELASEAIKLL